MNPGQFCFLSDKYYSDFPDDKLMKNKECINGVAHNRPCFFAFPDSQNKDILWLVPVSSQYQKYQDVYQKKLTKYGKCNTLCFGTLLNKPAVFLIQNMCPVSMDYISVYHDKLDKPIQVDRRVQSEVISNASEVLAKVRRGAKIVFPDVMYIYHQLELQLQNLQVSKSLQPKAKIATQETTPTIQQPKKEPFFLTGKKRREFANTLHKSASSTPPAPKPVRNHPGQDEPT